MKEEFNLSKEEFRVDFPALKLTINDPIYREKHVKEFIKIEIDWVKEHIKEGKMIDPKRMLHVIKCGAGEKLI